MTSLTNTEPSEMQNPGGSKPKKDKKSLNIYTDMPIWKSVLKMAIPSMILMLVTGAYMFSDSVLSINLAGDSYQAGILSANDKVRLYMNGFQPINSLIIAVTMLFGMGIATRVAINLGAKRHDRAVNTIKTGFMVGMIVAILLLPVLMLTAKPWIASQYDPSIKDDVAKHAFNYAWIIIMSLPLMMFNQIIPSLLRVEARNKEMLIAMILPIGINLFFDWVLMGPAGMGVEGGAWATFISYVLTSILLVFFILMRKNSFITFKNMFGFKLKMITLVGVILVGIGPFLRNVAQSITSTVQMNVIHEVSSHVYGSMIFSPSDIAAGQAQILLGLYQQTPTDPDLMRILGEANIGSGEDMGAMIHKMTQWALTHPTDPYLAAHGVTQGAQAGLASNFMTLIITGVMPIFMLFFPVMFGFAQASRPIASYNYGAKNFDRVKQTFWWTIFYAFTISILIYFLVSFALAGPLMDALHVTGLAREKALVVIKITMLSLPLFALAIGAMVIFGSTDRLLWSIISTAFQGLIAFWPVIFSMKAAAMHVEWEYFFWFFMPMTTFITSIVVTSGVMFTLKNLNNPKQITLDERIERVYEWARNRRQNQKSL